MKSKLYREFLMREAHRRFSEWVEAVKSEQLPAVQDARQKLTSLMEDVETNMFVDWYMSQQKEE